MITKLHCHVSYELGTAGEGEEPVFAGPSSISFKCPYVHTWRWWWDGYYLPAIATTFGITLSVSVLAEQRKSPLGRYTGWYRHVNYSVGFRDIAQYYQASIVQTFRDICLLKNGEGLSELGYTPTIPFRSELNAQRKWYRLIMGNTSSRGVSPPGVPRHSYPQMRYTLSDPLVSGLTFLVEPDYGRTWRGLTFSNPS